MKTTFSRTRRIVTGLVLVSALLASCGGSGESQSKTRNSVLAGGPCISIPADQTNDWKADVPVSFCPGAATYSTDGGSTKISVPEGKILPIDINQWPGRKGTISKISVLSYDGEGILIGDDVVTSTSVENCADGGTCTKGDTGPNGGTVIPTNDGTYIEIEAGGSERSPLISQSDAVTAATALVAPWTIPTVTQLLAILTATESDYSLSNQSTINSRLSDHKFADADAPRACTNPPEANRYEYYVSSYCYFHPYWTKDSDVNRTTLNTVQRGITPAVNYTMGFSLNTRSYVKYNNTYCDVNATANKNCLGTILPIREYIPIRKQRNVKVEQVDRDRWQENCTEAPRVTVGGNKSDADTIITIRHACIANARAGREIIVHLNVWRTDSDGSQQPFISKEQDADPQNKSIWTLTGPEAANGYESTYKLPIGNYQAKAWIEFERVGDLRVSAPLVTSFTIVSQNQLDCTNEKFTLSENTVTLNCDGINDLSAELVTATYERPKVDITNNRSIKIPDEVIGWFELNTSYKIEDDFVQHAELYACISQCDRQTSDKVSITDFDSSNYMIVPNVPNTKTWLKILLRPNPDQDLYTVPRIGMPTFIGGETILPKISDAFTYWHETSECTNMEEKCGSVSGFGFVTSNSLQPTTVNTSTMEETSGSVDDGTTTTVEPIARIQVIGVLDPATPIVELPQTDAAMVISTKELADVASIEVRIDGVTESYSTTSGDISIPVAKTASAVVITTVSKSGVKEVFTKVISRPSQLSSVDQVAVAGSEDASSSSNNILWLLLGAMFLLLLLVLFIFNKFRTSNNS
jgi:hypothetical protein